MYVNLNLITALEFLHFKSEYYFKEFKSHFWTQNIIMNVIANILIYVMFNVNINKKY